MHPDKLPSPVRQIAGGAFYVTRILERSERWNTQSSQSSSLSRRRSSCSSPSAQPQARRLPMRCGNEEWEHKVSYTLPYEWELNYDRNGLAQERSTETHYTVSIESKSPLPHSAAERTLRAIAAVGAEYEAPFPHHLRIRISFGKGGGLAFGQGRVWINRLYLSERRDPLQFERLVAHEVSHNFMQARANHEGVTTFRMLIINEWLADYAAFRAVGKKFPYACGTSASINPTENSIRMVRDFDKPFRGCTFCHRQYGIPRLFETEAILGDENLTPRIRALYEQSATAESLTWNEFVDGLADGGTEEQRAEVREVWETLLEWGPPKTRE